MAEPQAALREHLLYLLQGGGAHAGFDDALADVSPAVRGAKPKGVEHSLWELLEHMRIAQWDILRFSIDPDHVSPDFPRGYWPASPEPPSDAAWGESVQSLLADLEAMCRLVEDESTDLYQRIPHGSGQTVLREALLVADHNTYHLGQFVMLRKLLGAWEA